MSAQLDLFEREALAQELEQARAALAAMAHRGAVWPDGVLERVSLQMRIRKLERRLEDGGR